MLGKSLKIIVLAGALFLNTTSLAAESLATPAATARGGDTNKEISPEQMGRQFENMLQQIIQSGNALSKKAYGIDLEQEMGVNQKAPLADSRSTPNPQGTPGDQGVKTGNDVAKMTQGIVRDSTDMIGRSMAVLGKLAEMDLKEMQKGSGSTQLVPQTESARKAEELVGQGTMKAMLGDPAGSIPLFQQAIVLSPEFGTAYYNLACAYARQGVVEKFAPPLRKAIAIDAKYRGMAQRDSDFDQVRKSTDFRAIVEQ